MSNSEGVVDSEIATGFFKGKITGLEFQFSSNCGGRMRRER
jgi:hypothetical protein